MKISVHLLRSPCIRMVPYLNWSAGQVAWVQFSSLPSRQSWSKSQRHFSGIHFSSSRHLNSVGRQFNLLHLKSLSSDLSPQSLFPSHFQLLGIHFPLAQVNWSTLKFKRNHFFIVALKRTKWYFASKNWAAIIKRFSRDHLKKVDLFVTD